MSLLTKSLRHLLGKKSLLKFTDSSKKHDNGRGNYNHHGKLVGTSGITGTHSHGGTFTHGGLDTFGGEISSNMIARPGGGVMVLVTGDVNHEDAGGELRFKHEDDAKKHLSSMKVKTPAEIQTEMEENGASLLDTIRDDLANATDGLGALKALIDDIHLS